MAYKYSFTLAFGQPLEKSHHVGCVERHPIALACAGVNGDVERAHNTALCIIAVVVHNGPDVTALALVELHNRHALRVEPLQGHKQRCISIQTRDAAAQQQHQVLYYIRGTRRANTK